MKMYSRQEFMKLPEGTIFSSGPQYGFSDIQIKGETWEVDFLESSLVNIDSFNHDEWSDRMQKMHEKCASYPINKDYGREGLFDNEMVYLVYEKEDLEYMIEKFKEAILIHA